MTQRSSFPGLAGAAPRSFFGRGSVGAPPPPEPVPDFVLSNDTVATAWGVVLVGTLTPINAPAGAFFRLKQTAGLSGDESGYAVVNG